MPEFQLSRLGADRPRQELVTQTDPKVRDLLLQNAGDNVETGVEVRGIARTGRYDHSVRLKSLDLFTRGAERNDCHPTAPLDKRSNDVALHTTVEDDDVRPHALDSLSSPAVTSPTTSCSARQRRFSRACDEIRIASFSGVLDDHSPGVADFSDVQSQGARVDSGDPWDPVALQEFVDRSSRSGVAGHDPNARARRDRRSTVGEIRSRRRGSHNCRSGDMSCRRSDRGTRDRS